jgi:hypothetical protein
MSALSDLMDRARAWDDAHGVTDDNRRARLAHQRARIEQWNAMTGQERLRVLTQGRSDPQGYQKIHV